MTAAAIGSAYYSLPAGCGYYSAYSYYHCGGAWYAPSYQGDDVTYVVVEAPEGAPAEPDSATTVITH